MVLDQTLAVVRKSWVRDWTLVVKRRHVTDLYQWHVTIYSVFVAYEGIGYLFESVEKWRSKTMWNFFFRTTMLRKTFFLSNCYPVFYVLLVLPSFQDLTTSILPAVLPHIHAVLQDNDDDVRAVAAASLVSVVEQIQQTIPKQASQ